MHAHSVESSHQAVSRIETFATWLIVGCVFIGVSLLSVPIPGVNEPHYLSKARSYVDPDWCAADFFLQSADAHAVFFAVVGPLTQWVSFDATILIGRTLSLLLLSWGWGMLGRNLRLSSSAIIMAACTFCLIAMTGNFSGEWVIGGFESKVPAYGCALAAVAFWLRATQSSMKKHYVIAGVLAGLAVSWHPIVGLWFCIGMAATETMLVLPVSASAEPASVRLQKLLRNGLLFGIVAFLFALPGLVPAIRVLMSADLPVNQRDQANYIQVFWRLAHHLDPSSFPASAWIHTGILAVICCGGLIAIWRRRGPIDVPIAVQKSGRRSTWWPFIGLLFAAAATAAAAVFIGWHDRPAIELENWPLKAILLKFYAFRFFDALLPMTVALIVSKLLCESVSSALRKCFLVIMIACTVAAANEKRPEAPSAYTAQSFSGWKAACGWIKENTPADSLVFGPRESFGLKLFAERAEYVCFKDCPQDAAGILEWNRRLWAIHNWSQQAYQDSLFDEADLQTLHQQTGVTHVLTRRLGPFSMEPIGQFGVWRVYEVTDESDGVK